MQNTRAHSFLICALGTGKVLLQCPHGGHRTQRAGPKVRVVALPGSIRRVGPGGSWSSLGCGEHQALWPGFWPQHVLPCTLGLCCRVAEAHWLGMGLTFLVQPICCGNDVTVPPSAANSANLAQNACLGTSVLGLTARSVHEKNHIAYNLPLPET